MERLDRYVIWPTAKESVPVLLVALLLGILAGQMLNLASSIVIIPWVLFSIPLINGIGGNLGTVLGARLSSALHLGSITPRLEGEAMEDEVLTGLTLGIITYGSLAFVSMIVAPVLGVQMPINLVKLGLLVAFSGILLTFVVLAISMLSAVYSFRFGLDPDNAVAPLTASSGDIAGIMCVILVLQVVGV